MVCMNMLHYLRERFRRPGYAEETLRGYIESTPAGISRERTLRRFLSDGRRRYAKLDQDERMVFLIADAEAVISAEGWKKCFTDPTRINHTQDLVRALETIGEPHTISMINDFLNELKNHGYKFESDSVRDYVENYPVVDSFWNRRFMIKSQLRWSRLKDYFMERDSPVPDEAILLH